MTSVFDNLANEERWVGWRNEDRGGKLTKVPFGRGGRAKADDPGTWVVRAEAEKIAARIVNGRGGGLGIELGDLGHDLFIAGVDLDSCVGKDRCLAPWAERILGALDTYAEYSPSGTGIKAFFYVTIEHARQFLELVGITDAKQWGLKRSVGEDGRDHGPAVEIYFSHRYFAVTEQVLPGRPQRLVLLDWPVLQDLARLIPPLKSTTGSTANGRDGSRSATAFRKGTELRRAGKTFEEMVEALRDDPETADWVLEKGMPFGMRELHRIWDKAGSSFNRAAGGVSLEDFHAYMPMHSYIYAPTREMWPASSVNARVPPIVLVDASGRPMLNNEGKPKTIRANLWLDQNRPVEQMTWAPGLPLLITDRLVAEGGWIDREGVSCFNLYRPPTIEPGDPAQADLWLEHVRVD